MSKSIIRKLPRARRNVANANGATNINNGQIKIDLNKDFLVSEHVLNIGVSQTWGTNAPSSSDVRRFFSRIELQTDKGAFYSCDFHQFYDQARFTESQASPVVALGAGGGAAAAAQFSVDMHHINDGAVLDMLSAMQSSEYSTISLILTPSADAANGFIGGTGAVGVAAYTIGVDSCEYPGMSGKTLAERSKIVYGKARHQFKALMEKSSASSAASNQEVNLVTGGKCRFLFLHSYNTTGAIPTLANGIVDKLNLSIGGVVYLSNVQFRDLQQENVANRSFNQTGVAVVDMGDDEHGWIPLHELAEAKLLYSTLGTAPAGWKVTIAQDFTTGLKELGA